MAKSIVLASLLLVILNGVRAFVPREKCSSRRLAQPNSIFKIGSHIDGGYRSSPYSESDNDDSAFSVDYMEIEDVPFVADTKGLMLPVQDPSAIAIEDSKPFEREALKTDTLNTVGHYPVSLMMQDCAPYIASHTGKTAVFHIPGNLLEGSVTSQCLLSDMVVAYLLGMKIVVVVGNRADSDSCSTEFSHPHECHNSLRVVDEDSLRAFEEEAGFLRTEIERKLNRCMHMHGNGHQLDGNVVSGHFYTAQKYGRIRGQDFQCAGYVGEVHVENIKKVLADNDIVLLSTVGLCRMGELVNVNGYHLASSVASALKAYKLVYMASEGSVLHKKGGGHEDIIRELPVSFAKDILDHFKVKVHPKGFAYFEEAQKDLEPRAVELLLHLGWASIALDNGVKRAHIVNPTDGALLEELFTSENGANTCLFRDDELTDSDEDISEDEWDDFFSSAKVARKGEVASFG